MMDMIQFNVKIIYKQWIALIFCIITCSIVFAQYGEIKGKVIDGKTGEGLIGATVTLQINKITEGITTDVDGFYHLKNIPSGIYDLTASYLGYQNSVSKDVVVKKDSLIQVDFKMEVGTQLSEVAVIAYNSTVKSTRKRRLIPRKDSRAKTNAYYTDGIKENESDHKEGNTEDYDEIKENNFKAVTADPVSTFSIDVDAASYANVRRMINNGKVPVLITIIRSQPVSIPLR